MTVHTRLCFSMLLLSLSLSLFSVSPSLPLSLYCGVSISASAQSWTSQCAGISFSLFVCIASVLSVFVLLQAYSRFDFPTSAPLLTCRSVAIGRKLRQLSSFACPRMMCHFRFLVAGDRQSCARSTLTWTRGGVDAVCHLHDAP